MTNKSIINVTPWIVAGLIAAGSIACSKETPISPENAPEATTSDKESLQQPEERELRALVASMPSYDPVAVEYCNNIKTVMSMTGALDRPQELSSLMSATTSASTTVSLTGMTGAPVTSVSSAAVSPSERFYAQLNEEQAAETVNPMSLKLNSLEITNEETGKPVSFFDIPAEQKEVFVDYLLVDEAKDLSDKLEKVPELKEVIEKENEAIGRAIQSTGAPVETVEASTNTLRSTRTFGKKRVDSKAFFTLVKKEIEKEFSAKEELRFIRIPINHEDPTMPFEKTRDLWASVARRGDFVLAIPKHGNSNILLNTGSKFAIGHAGVITKAATKQTRQNENLSIEAYKNQTGVQYCSIGSWNAAHYIMGIQRVSYKWKWRGFKSRFHKICTPVPNPGLLADWAERYVTRPYASGVMFLAPKLFAPANFTCTTLVWWCAKQAYGINVSNWWSPIVTPSNLYTDNSTYVRGEVKP